MSFRKMWEGLQVSRLGESELSGVRNNSQCCSRDLEVRDRDRDRDLMVRDRDRDRDLDLKVETETET